MGHAPISEDERELENPDTVSLADRASPGELADRASPGELVFEKKKK